MSLPTIIVPRYEGRIPSTGKKFTYRPYLVGDEKVLMIALESDDSAQMMTAVMDIVDMCTDDSVDVSKLTEFDIEYIFLNLRAKSYGETAQVGLRCQKCNSKVDVEIVLPKVEVRGILEKEKAVKITDTIGVILRYPTAKEFFRIRSDEEMTPVDKVFAYVRACITTIYSSDEFFDVSDQPEEEVNKFINSLTSTQFKEIREFSQNIPTATVPVEFTCPSCSEHNTLDIVGLASFFK
jgi:hypothetical protein